MYSFFEILGKIRELINSPLKQPALLDNKLTWNKLCSSLDSIEDSEHAIQKYQELEEFEGHEGYLLLYGLLQAIFLQQDAVNSLSKALIDSAINFENEYPELYRIREIRNDSIGHPTNRKNGKLHISINQISIKKSGFEYTIYSDSYKPKFEYVNLDSVISTQEKITVEILNKLFNVLEKEINDHKLQFSEENIGDFISPNIDYFFQKIYQATYSNSDPASYTEANLKYLSQDVFEKIVGVIIKRYDRLEAIPGLENQVKKIRYIFNSLFERLKEGIYPEGFESEIMIDSLREEFRELKELIDDIDREFQEK